MELDLAINELVEVKATGVRLGHRGWMVNRFARNRPLYAVQFPDKCIGYFERCELERAPSEVTATDWEAGKGFHDIADLETRP
jgi:hypothetical protein